MGAILKQRNFLLTKEFELTEQSLKVRISKPFNFLEEQFSFEQLTSKIKRKKSPNIVAAIMTLIVLVCIAATIYSHFFEKNGSTFFDILFYVVALFILIVVNYFAYENIVYLTLTDTRQILFFANSPNYKTVNDFLDLILAEQKKYLLNRYAKVDHYLTKEQLSNNLQWLWDRQIINDAELNDLRSQILGDRLEETKSVGFKITPKVN